MPVATASHSRGRALVYADRRVHIPGRNIARIIDKVTARKSRVKHYLAGSRVRTVDIVAVMKVLGIVDWLTLLEITAERDGSDPGEDEDG